MSHDGRKKLKSQIMQIMIMQSKDAEPEYRINRQNIKTSQNIILSF